jgi:ubiquinone/menaquinone biosynthesis C-methylase UbiE
MSDHPIAAGKSSYDLIDPDIFWPKLALTPDSTVLDLGCGAGRYTLPMASRIGPAGKVIALDLWAEGIEQLRDAAHRDQIANIDARVADAGRTLPLEDQSVDMCFMATVLHDFMAAGIGTQALREVKRVLKPQGIIAIVEFKKEDSPNGPPRSIRLAVEDLAMLVQRLGFIRFSGVIDLGPDLYLAQFRRLFGGRR